MLVGDDDGSSIRKSDFIELFDAIGLCGGSPCHHLVAILPRPDDTALEELDRHRPIGRIDRRVGVDTSASAPCSSIPCLTFEHGCEFGGDFDTGGGFVS